MYYWFMKIGGKKMKHDEDELQIACVKWFSMQYPKLSKLLHHSPNGGRRNAREAARFKKMGTRAGFPDLILMYPAKGFHGLCIEMKTATGRQQATQKEWQKQLESVGYKYELCRSIEAFIAITKDYLVVK